MDDTGKRQFGTSHVLAILAAIIFYPISMGPAFYVYALLGQSDALRILLGCIYFPLISLPEPLNGMLTRYVGWWCELGGMPT